MMIEQRVTVTSLTLVQGGAVEAGPAPLPEVPEEAMLWHTELSDTQRAELETDETFQAELDAKLERWVHGFVDTHDEAFPDETTPKVQDFVERYYANHFSSPGRKIGTESYREGQSPRTLFEAVPEEEGTSKGHVLDQLRWQAYESMQECAEGGRLQRAARSIARVVGGWFNKDIQAETPITQEVTPHPMPEVQYGPSAETAWIVSAYIAERRRAAVVPEETEVSGWRTAGGSDTETVRAFVESAHMLQPFGVATFEQAQQQVESDAANPVSRFEIAPVEPVASPQALLIEMGYSPNHVDAILALAISDAIKDDHAAAQEWDKDFMRMEHQETPGSLEQKVTIDKDGVVSVRGNSNPAVVVAHLHNYIETARMELAEELLVAAHVQAA